MNRKNVILKRVRQEEMRERNGGYGKQRDTEKEDEKKITGDIKGKALERSHE